MAEIVPIATQAVSLFQTVNTIAQVFNDGDGQRDDLALQQLEQQQKLQEAQALQNAETDRAEIAVAAQAAEDERRLACLLYTSPSPRDGLLSRMPSSA